MIKVLENAMNEVWDTQASEELKVLANLLWYSGMYGPYYCIKQPTLENLQTGWSDDKDVYSWGDTVEGENLQPIDEEKVCKLFADLMEDIIENHQYLEVWSGCWLTSQPEYVWDEELSEEENNAEAEAFYEINEYYEVSADDWYEKVLGRVYNGCYKGWF